MSAFPASGPQALAGELTLSSLSFMHSSQPPSNAFFMRLMATSLLPRYSGRLDGPGGRLPGGMYRGECQSASQTVPKEPSPTSLRTVQCRGASGGKYSVVKSGSAAVRVALEAGTCDDWNEVVAADGPGWYGRLGEAAVDTDMAGRLSSGVGRDSAGFD